MAYAIAAGVDAFLICCIVIALLSVPRRPKPPVRHGRHTGPWLRASKDAGDTQEFRAVPARW